MNKVCLDANVWIKVLTTEADTPLAHDLVTRLFRERREIIAPVIMKVEVGTVLRKKWSRKLISDQDLNELWQHFLALPISYLNESSIYKEAWKIAERNHLVHLYDAIYVAISSGIEFWTADERLVNSIKHSDADIHLL